MSADPRLLAKGDQCWVLRFFSCDSSFISNVLIGPLVLTGKEVGARSRPPKLIFVSVSSHGTLSGTDFDVGLL
jgi:hypothetical protein